MTRHLVCVGALLLCLGCSGKTGSSAGSDKGGSTPKQGSASAGGAAEARGNDAGSQGGPQSNDAVVIARDDQHRAGIVIAPVEFRSVSQLLTVAGQVEMDQQHTSHIGAIADGRITEVRVLPGAAVHRGEVLAQIHSHTVHETVGALVQAYAALERQRGAVTFAQQAQDRYHHLYSIQAASLEESQRSDQELLQARNQLADAEAAVRMEREHLSELLQVPPETLTPTDLYSRELVPVRSTIAGVVIARNVTVGQVVDTGYDTFVVSDLHTVWVSAAVNEHDLAMVHIGAVTRVSTEGTADRFLVGRVAMIGDTLDPQTRTVPVRVLVPNPATRLRPGMFASLGIDEPQTRTAVFVPENALQDINGMRVVFTTADGTHFKAQAVTPGARSQGQVEVTQGLKPGDHVVVDGAFMVKSEMLRGTMGEG